MTPAMLRTQLHLAAQRLAAARDARDRGEVGAPADKRERLVADERAAALEVVRLRTMGRTR